MPTMPLDDTFQQAEPTSNAHSPTRKPIPRRNSLIPSIKKWAVSINRDSENMQRLFSQQLLQRRRSMDDQTLDDDAEQDDSNGDPVRSINRRASLDVDVERAIAMVNEYPELDKDDRLLSPFGNRRDSLL